MKIWTSLVAALGLASAASAKDITVRVNGHAVHLDVGTPACANPKLPTIVFVTGAAPRRLPPL